MSAVAISTVSSMYDLADDLLGTVVDAMGTTVGGVPDRSFVSLGAPAWETDCAQAAVQILTLTEEGTRDQSPSMQPGLRHFRGAVNLVGMVAYAIRCVQISEGNAQVYDSPGDTQLSAEARAAYEDGWAIWNLVKRRINSGVLFSPSGGCFDAHFDLGVPFTPAGGLGGWQFTIRVELGGYEPIVSS